MVIHCKCVVCKLIKWMNVQQHKIILLSRNAFFVSSEFFFFDFLDRLQFKNNFTLSEPLKHTLGEIICD